MIKIFIAILTALLLAPLAALKATGSLNPARPEFPPELVEFGPASEKPLFAGTGANMWDRMIRERGWVMREDGIWHMWFTGYNYDITTAKSLGYATSPDGITWTRWPGNPLTTTGWVEDVCIVKHEGTYFMFAEGKDDIAHLLTSKDRLHWEEQGDLDIRQTNGQPISAGPRGTPSAIFEKDRWWLLYERDDHAIFAATSRDLKTWTNVTDEPVIKMGPEAYDQHAVAVDQIIKHKGRYYAYYHASATEPWVAWSTCIAMSEDLVHWQKYPHNPILRVNPAMPGAGSGTVVHDGKGYRFYTTHPDVRVYMPKHETPAPKP